MTVKNETEREKLEEQLSLFFWLGVEGEPACLTKEEFEKEAGIAKEDNQRT